MNLVVRGLRVIDPSQGLDDVGLDLRIEDGLLSAIGRSLEPSGTPVIDMTPRPGAAWRVLCPGFVDLHTHLRQPGGEAAETIASGARAGAAGGFTQIVAMANTDPAVDTPARVTDAERWAAEAEVAVYSVAALSRGLRGEEVVDVEACAEAGAVAFSDDGRNALSPGTLLEGLRRSAAVFRPVLVHPEDESAIARTSIARSPARSIARPPAVEVAAVASALASLREARVGHLHLQHISTARSVELVAAAKREGLAVTAEVTPHHLGLWLPSDEQPKSDPLLKVNPPLRTREDRDALVQALRDGTVDCVATDHAPHAAGEKALPYADAAPGMIGLETALAACLTLGDMGQQWLPTLLARLTAGPYGVLRAGGLLRKPGLRVGSPASCVLFDPDEEWVVEGGSLRSRSRNTPLLGATLRGKVLLTIDCGRVVHRDTRLPLDVPAPARA
jgi:dihydroorotase